MARNRSRIQQEVSAEHLAELNGVILTGKLTIDELVDWLEGKGYEFPRSNVGRHVQSVETVAAQIRQTREMTAGLLESLGPEDDDGTRAAQLQEMVHTLIHRGVVELLADPEIEIGPADLARLAKTVKDFSSAQKSSVDRLINAAKLQAAKAATRAAAEKVKDAIQSRGLSAEVASDIERVVLGLS